MNTLFSSDDANIKTLIAKASEIIAPLWPMQTVIARNPLQCIEFLKFEDAFLMGERFLASRSEENDSEINREMIKWCQVFLDDGQATINMPEREKGFYRSWALLAPYDKNLSRYNKNSWLSTLPSQAEEAILFCLKKINIPNDQIEEYFRYSLAELPGWAGYIKWLSEWKHKTTEFKHPITLTDFLAVRLVMTCAIKGEAEIQHKGNASNNLKLCHKELMTRLKANEERYLQNLLKEGLTFTQLKLSPSKAAAQIVFCIDVRSEPFRLRLEREGNYETFGCAGFFGLPVSIHNYNNDNVKACCPVLIEPQHEIFEEPIEKNSKRVYQHQKGKAILNVVRRFYQDLKYNFATPFALVETLGPWCGLWMAIRTLMPRFSSKLKKTLLHKIMPNIATSPQITIPLGDQVLIAESTLRTMGLTQNFSPLVVLCGHGSQTENNPYASALNCGACGGHSGGQNAKILAAILNFEEVRASLKERDIVIPVETRFISAEHNTTTDEVVFDEVESINSFHKEIIQKLKQDCIKASAANSYYRCKAFDASASFEQAKMHVLQRSSNWAEVRPEWGLARNAAFIVGPRALTKNSSLDGRCFLHSYEWSQDETGKSLETILTAPMVVAEWINTQYLFSTLNNIAYGSGSKITHNVTGKIGIMQGNGSDLKQGLPLQSVNSSDDEAYHELMRLQVIVYAPRRRVESLIKKHEILQTLIFNQWVKLIVIEPMDSKPYCFSNNLWSQV